MLRVSLKLKIFIFVVLIGQVVAILGRLEIFPFSPYGMYSEKFDGQCKKMEVTGVPTKKAFWPFFEAGLSESLILHFEKDPSKIKDIGRDLMDLYQRRRLLNKLPELSNLTINLINYQIRLGSPPKQEKLSETLIVLVTHEN
jgi:hypothetical protein